jgi:signal peptidase I
VLAALNAPGGGGAEVRRGPGAPGTDLPATAAPRGGGKPGARPANDEGSIKETIESILVAFVLAFIFRAFVVEAFVIPTGSMAPTLLGAHMRFTCEDCGYRFDVNYSGRTIGDDVEIPNVATNKVYSLNCPNCGLKVPKQDARDPDSTNDATSPPVHYGDRILVLKYAYLLSDPSRWDVVVFKTPDRPEHERQQTVPPYTVNYIKRLVGRPGESVFILDGDIYAAPAGTPVERHEVQPKTRAAQEALWRIVFDHDHLPDREDWQDPWTPADGTGWALRGPRGPDDRPAPPASPDAATAGPSRVLRFAHTGGAGWLRFDPDADPGNQALTDWLAYAATKPPGSGDSYDHPGLVARNNVSDLKLSLFYHRAAGDGPLRLQLTKLGTVFTAEFTPGKVRLLRGGAGSDVTVEVGSAELPATTGPLRIEFSNVDYRVTVRVNDRDLIQTTPQEYRPDFERLITAWQRDEILPKPQIRIGAENQSCALSHVALWRDIYYTNRDNPYAAEIRWGTPTRPIQLGKGEYWVLGDNSLMSGDGRYWGMPVELPDEQLPYVQPGVVPERFLLGKAFFVYWPAGYRIAPRSPGLVPNFGDMRFIH